MQIDAINIKSDDIDKRNNFKTISKKFVIKDVVDFSNQNGGLPIYACDKVSKTVGAKVFYCASYNEFYLLYTKLPTNDRCFYETLLPEQPCHLYLDMEQDIDTIEKMNEVVDMGNELLEELCTYLVEFARDACKKSNIVIKKEDIRIIELDSSTPKKFSRHYIIKVKNGLVMFNNNFHCGAFMRRFQKYVIQIYGHPNEDNKFFHNHTSDRTGDTAKNFLIDMGVYTLRRQFRLIGSAKRTKDSKNRRELWVKGKEHKLTIELFLDCLVQYINHFGKLYLIKVSEINGTDPMSSSLRSFDQDGNPISIAQNAGVRHAIDINNSITRYSTNEGMSKKQKLEANTGDETTLPSLLQQAFKKFYFTKYGYSICGYIIGKNKIKLETTDRQCMNKQKLTGESEHKFNHVYFIVYPETMFHIQGCYDDTYCSSKGIKSFTKLGRIDDENLEKELNLWLSQRKYKKWYNILDTVSESWTPNMQTPPKIKEDIVNCKLEEEPTGVPVNRIKMKKDEKTKII